MTRAGFFTRQEIKGKTKRVGPGESLMMVRHWQKLGVRGVQKMNPDAQTPDMPPSGSKKPELYILGEAPGRTEDEEGRQFVGESGQYLRERLDSLSDVPTRWNNVVRTRPPKNRTPTRQEIECFRPSLIEDIERTKPPIILAVGPTSLNWLLGDEVGNITTCRGRWMAGVVGKHHCFVYPILHPTYVIRTLSKAEEKGDDTPLLFDLDLKRFRRDFQDMLSETPAVITAEEMRSDITHVMTVKELQSALDTILESPSAAFDYETTMLRPYHTDAQILSIAIATQKGTWAIPLAHRESPFRGELLGRVTQMLVEWLRQPRQRKIVQNLPFELEWAGVKWGTDAILDCDNFDCTMSQAFVLDERWKGRSLDFLCRQYFALGLKAISKMRSMDEARISALLDYNGMDAKAALALDRAQFKRIKREGLEPIYEEHRARIPSLVLAQIAGLITNQKEVRRHRDILAKQMDVAVAKIAKLEDVKVYKRKFGDFNPNSNTQLIAFIDGLGIRRETDSVDEDALAQIDHPITDLILKYREVAKQKVTYVDPLDKENPDCVLHPDGRIHAIFNSTGTVSGRHSGSDPNLLNYPKHPHAELRSMVEPDKGHRMVAVDGGQMEARVIAMHSKDKVLVKQIWDNYDFHMYWAKRIVELDGAVLRRNEGDWKKTRNGIKSEFSFPLFYGSKPGHIAHLLQISKTNADRVVGEFWGMYRDVKRWQEDLIKSYHENGYVEGLTGRRRRAPISDNQIINTPIQGCLKSGSRVWTSKGLLPIEELVGKRVCVQTGAGFADAIGLDRGFAELAEITLESGLVIHCDTRHKLKSIGNRWTHFEDLRRGDHVALPDSHTPLEWCGKYSLAYILGAYLGDGCYYARRSRKTTAVKDYPVLAIVGGVKKYTLLTAIARWADGHGFPNSMTLYPRKRMLTIRGRRLGRMMTRLGIKFGVTAHTKRVPEIIWRASPQHRRDYLQGLWDTDGGRVGWNLHNLHMCNQELISDVQRLSASIGIDSQQYVSNDGYGLRYRGHLQSLRVYPWEQLCRDVDPDGVKSACGDSARIAEHRAVRRGVVSHPVARRIYGRYAPSAEFYRYDRIKTIKRTGVFARTYTMSVDHPLHQFVADGVIHKNTAADIIFDGMNRLTRLAYRKRMPWLQARINIYDDLTFSIPEEYVKSATKIIVREMLNYKAPWLNVPLQVEVMEGPNWFELKEVGKYLSTELTY